jgi:hypothetical protein
MYTIVDNVDNARVTWNTVEVRYTGRCNNAVGQRNDYRPRVGPEQEVRCVAVDVGLAYLTS